MSEFIRDNIKLILGDCMDIMKTYPDNYFDLAVVDPPYGINFSQYQRTNIDKLGNRYKAEHYKAKDWDDSIPDELYFNELKRVSKNQIIWGGNYFFDILGNSKGLICWFKHQPVNNFADCEYAWTNIDRPAKVFDYKYFGNLEGSTKANQKYHPTQKPIELYNWIFKNYAKKEMKILDTHGGSFNPPKSAYMFECKEFVGIEKDKDYFDKAIVSFNKFVYLNPKHKNDNIFEF